MSATSTAGGGSGSSWPGKGRTSCASGTTSSGRSPTRASPSAAGARSTGASAPCSSSAPGRAASSSRPCSRSTSCMQRTTSGPGATPARSESLAQRRSANVDAAELFQRALVAAEHLELPPAEVGYVAEALGDVCELAARYEEAGDAYLLARELAEDALVQSRLMRKEGVLRERLGSYPEALEWYGRGLQALDGSGCRRQRRREPCAARACDRRREVSAGPLRRRHRVELTRRRACGAGRRSGRARTRLLLVAPQPHISRRKGRCARPPGAAHARRSRRSCSAVQPPQQPRNRGVLRRPLGRGLGAVSAERRAERSCGRCGQCRARSEQRGRDPVRPGQARGGRGALSGSATGLAGGAVSGRGCPFDVQSRPSGRPPGSLRRVAWSCSTRRAHRSRRWARRRSRRSPRPGGWSPWCWRGTSRKPSTSCRACSKEPVRIRSSTPSSNACTAMPSCRRAGQRRRDHASSGASSSPAASRPTTKWR